MSDARCSAVFVPAPAGRRTEDVFFSDAESDDDEAVFERCLCTTVPCKATIESAPRYLDAFA